MLNKTIDGMVLSDSSENFIAKSYLSGKKGLSSWLLTLDHKRIGLMYLAVMTFFFLLGGSLALTVRSALWNPGTSFITAGSYNQIFTLHAIVMLFLVMIPGISAVLGNFVLPLQIGAKDVAFPRLNLFSFYLYLLTAVLAIFSIIIGSVDTGWTFYTPYSILTEGGVVAVGLAVFVLGFSSILTGVNFIVTIHRMRAPGLNWFKLPLFTWGLYAASIIQVMATPVLGMTVTLLVIERVIGVGIFDPALGGDPVLFQHFFWFYSHPAVYLLILPAMAIVSEIITTFSQKKIFGYKFLVYSTIAIALIGFAVWGHHLFVSGQSPLVNVLFSGLTMLVTVPTAVKVFSWLATMHKGAISLKAPMLFALTFLFFFSVGGLTGIYLAVLTLNVHLHDTSFVVAHFHYVLVGSVLMAFLGGIHYWWPKMFGRLYNEKIAVTGLALIFVGFNLAFFVLFVAGIQGMPRRSFYYLEQFRPYNQLSTVGAYILGLGFLVVILNLFLSLSSKRFSTGNPWNATTLEWTHADSPPCEHNFKENVIVAEEVYSYGDNYCDKNVTISTPL